VNIFKEMKHNPILSIIVPIYGVDKYLVQCIKSILGQTFTDFELILVNDGSLDRCSFICDEFEKKDKRIKVIHKENGGLVSARKAGLKYSKGLYIGYVDGDDWIEPLMYEELLNLALKYDADIVAAGHKEEINGNVSEVLYNNLEEGLYTHENLHNVLFSKMINTGAFSQFGIFSYLWNKIFKREIIFDAQMEVDDNIFMAEDAACSYSAILNAKSVYIKHSAKYRYRQRVDSMVKSRDSNYLELEKFHLLYEHLKNVIKNSSHYSVLITQLNSFILSLLTVRYDMKYVLDLHENELFPFGCINKKSKLIILGAGTFGQYLVNRIIIKNEYSITGWIDNAYESQEMFGFKIHQMNELKKLKFDLILIAHIDETISEQKEKDLLHIGIHKSMILKSWINSNSNINEILIKMGINALD
jgi:glycosyltransferase involved in cell wall biosynthesis